MLHNIVHHFLKYTEGDHLLIFIQLWLGVKIPRPPRNALAA